MTKLSVRKPGASVAPPLDAPAIAELRMLHKKKRETTRRLEELKIKIFHVTERHMDQAVSILKGWLKT